jgi:hypothetical protein
MIRSFIRQQLNKVQAKQASTTVDNSQATCLTCKLCSGDKLNVFVEAHGSGKKYVTNLA